MLKEALFYEKLGERKVQCRLCNHFCVLTEGDKGRCGVRVNLRGTLYALNYGEVVSSNVDPVEKKPLFNFFPRSLAYSIATLGCNFSCKFCQNWEISQVEESKKIGIEPVYTNPSNIIKKAHTYRCKSIAYTYTEPTIFLEYAFDCMKLARERNIKNIWVTNGYMTKEALDYIGPYLDAANIDLKSFRDDFYKRICGGRLKPVLDTIKYAKKMGIWLEITTLIIPGENDSPEELSDIASFVASLGKETPWHITRFLPAYKFKDHPTTGMSILKEAYDIGKEKGLRYVYIGNAYTDDKEDTVCWQCSKTVIKRTGYTINDYKIKDGRCAFCGAVIDGVGL